MNNKKVNFEGQHQCTIIKMKIINESISESIDESIQ